MISGNLRIIATAYIFSTLYNCGLSLDLLGISPSSKHHLVAVTSVHLTESFRESYVYITARRHPKYNVMLMFYSGPHLVEVVVDFCVKFC